MCVRARAGKPLPEEVGTIRQVCEYVGFRANETAADRMVVLQPRLNSRTIRSVRECANAS